MELSLLPFSSMKVTKLIGMNHQVPYCSILNEGKLIYAFGRFIILENTKNHEQKILWSNPFKQEIELVQHYISMYHENLLAVVVKDSEAECTMVAIAYINSIINNLEHREKKEKERECIHPMKHLERGEQIVGIKFVEEGSLFAVISRSPECMRYALYRTSIGDILMQETFTSQNLQVNYISMNRINYLTALAEYQSENHEKPTKFSSKTSKSLLQTNPSKEIMLTLRPTQQLEKKTVFTFYIEQKDMVLDQQFTNNNQSTLMFLLLSSGFILIFKLSQNQLTLQTKVDLRLSPPSKISTNKSNFLKVKNPIDSDTIHYPNSIQVASKKVICSYPSTSQLGVLIFSMIDPKDVKFEVISDLFSESARFKGIRHLKMSKDNCHCSIVMEISNEVQMSSFEANQEISEKELTNQAQSNSSENIIKSQISSRTVMSARSQMLVSNLTQQEFERQEVNKIDSFFQILQVDLVSAMIKHSHHEGAVEESLTGQSCHGQVELVEYNQTNNSMFVLLATNVLKYYTFHSLTKKQHKHFTPHSLLLWSHSLKDKPDFFICHPLNFTLAIFYSEKIRFHHYNCEQLFPADFTINLKNCHTAAFSPLGDKLALGVSNQILLLDCYSFKVIKTIHLLNLTNSIYSKHNSESKKHSVRGGKAVTKISFISNEDMIVRTGHSTYSMVINSQKIIYYGTLERELGKKGIEEIQNLMVYDAKHKLTIISFQKHLKVVAKSTLNTRNRCEILSRIQISASSIFLCSSLGVLFVGGKDGVLHVLKWPDYCQNESMYSSCNKYGLFSQKIISMNVSIDLKYIFCISQYGSICICQLIPHEDQDKISKQLRLTLIKSSGLSLLLENIWPLSAHHSEQKQRDLIKLRGTEAQINTQQTHNTDQEQRQLTFVLNKDDMEKQFIQAIKQYEQKEGIQKILHQICSMKDQIKMIHSQKQHRIQSEQLIHLDQISNIFRTKTLLEGQLNRQRIACSLEKKALIETFQKQLEEQRLMEEMQEDEIKLNKGRLAKMDENRLKVDKGIDIEVCEKYEEYQEQVAKQYDRELNEVQTVCSDLNNIQRSLQITINSINQKKNIMAQSFAEFQVDHHHVRLEQERLKSILNSLTVEDIQSKQRSNFLINKLKQLQEGLKLERSEGDKVNLKHKSLQLQLIDLQKEIDKLNFKYSQLDADFILQREIMEDQDDLLEQANIKLKQLKAQNQMLFNKSVTIKTFLNSNHQQVDDDFTQKGKNKVDLNCTDNIALKKVKNNKLTENALKWKAVKNTYMSKCYSNLQKLNEENQKLTFQYNDLTRVNQQYCLHIQNIQRQITIAKNNSSQPSSKNASQPNHPLPLQPQFANLSKINSKSSHQQIKNHANSTANSAVLGEPEKGLFSIRKTKMVCISVHVESGKLIKES